jgi:putative membrane protein
VGSRYVAGLSAVFGVIWLVFAIRPRDRADWALENALVVLAVLVIALAHRRLALSRLSHALVFAFLTIHVIGAHYTYSEVPYDDWVLALTGRSLDAALGWQRNNFDRIAHFAYGLLLTYPAREVVVRVAGLRGFWGYFLPVDLMVSSSASYELIEWAAAVAFGGDVGIAYVGAQGDPWDAQKDMALAALGAVLATAATAVTHRWRSERHDRLRGSRPPGYNRS